MRIWVLRSSDAFRRSNPGSPEARWSQASDPPGLRTHTIAQRLAKGFQGGSRKVFYTVPRRVLRSPDRSLKTSRRLPDRALIEPDGCRRVLRIPEASGMLIEKLGGFVTMEGAGNTLDVS